MERYTAEERRIFTQATMSVLDSWRLSTEEMRLILGLPEGVGARNFQKFRGQVPFPDEDAVQRRADYVLRIAGALRTTYPTNDHMGWRWLRQRHRRLGRKPLSVLLDEGEEGLIAVLAELDCTFGWDLSGSSPS